MILFEHEGKAILQTAGIAVPKSQLLASPDESIKVPTPCILKVQTLFGKRAAGGGIVKVEKIAEFKKKLSALFKLKLNGESVTAVLVEELIKYDKECYLSFSYDTETRTSVLSWSEKGGTDIEQRGARKVTLDLQTKNLPRTLPFPPALIARLFNLFLESDCLLLEINPLIKKGKIWYALDAKIKLDDDASGRHPEWHYPPRAVSGHQPTAREIAARAIDRDDYRGTAGSTYFDLDGDIGILASGGGASLLALDTLIAAGGAPANYTEYSGNPPREKVERLAEIVLSKPGLHGLWIVGAVANFTDIYETLSGIVEALKKAQAKSKHRFDFPIVVRRAGPREKEAFDMLKAVKDFDLHIYGREISIAESAKEMVKLAEAYRRKLPS